VASLTTPAKVKELLGLMVREPPTPNIPVPDMLATFIVEPVETFNVLDAGVEIVPIESDEVAPTVLIKEEVVALAAAIVPE
jgi:hypothetical protein